MRFRSDAQRKAVFATMNGGETTWLVFGDSIALGDYDSKGGWVNRLREKVYPDHLYNLSISGDDIKGVSNRIRDESKRRIGDSDKTKLIIAVGINDSKNGVSSIEKEFEDLLDSAEKIADKDDIAVVGLTPVDDDKAHLYDDRFNNSVVKNVDDKLKAICDDRDISFIDVYDKIRSKNLDDGLHPNTSGHNKIFDAVESEL